MEAAGIGGNLGASRLGVIRRGDAVPLDGGVRRGFHGSHAGELASGASSQDFIDLEPIEPTQFRRTGAQDRGGVCADLPPRGVLIDIRI